jgi:hypothetical protein
MNSSLSGCVSSIKASLSLLDSSIQILDSGISDFPRLGKVLQTERVCIPGPLEPGHELTITSISNFCRNLLSPMLKPLCMTKLLRK